MQLARSAWQSRKLSRLGKAPYERGPTVQAVGLLSCAANREPGFPAHRKDANAKPAQKKPGCLRSRAARPRGYSAAGKAFGAANAPVRSNAGLPLCMLRPQPKEVRTAVRMMLKIRIATEGGNRTIKDGTLPNGFRGDAFDR
jgi:hypothetical protein